MESQKTLAGNPSERTKELPKAIDELTVAITQLIQTVETLEQRLYPVLTPSEPQNQKIMKDSIFLTAAASCLNDQQQRISILNHIIIEICSRLEI